MLFLCLFIEKTKLGGNFYVNFSGEPGKLKSIILSHLHVELTRSNLICMVAFFLLSTTWMQDGQFLQPSLLGLSGMF